MSGPLDLVTALPRMAVGATRSLPDAGGAALAAFFGALAVARGDRPVHTLGLVLPGTLRVTPGRPTGIPLLDTPGETEVKARVSRSLSLTRGGPDVVGLALRIPGAGRDGGHADVLFLSSGTGVASRYVLVPRRAADTGPLTTVLPYGRPSGPRVLRLDPEGQRQYALSWGRLTGGWTGCGTLELSDPAPQRDEPIRFDPVGSPLEGFEAPPWLARLRDPAYVWARRLGQARAAVDPQDAAPADFAAKDR